MEQYVILHNIRSAHNVGSIFRTGDGAGVSKIFLSGHTPSPMDRFGRENAEISKTSLGATHMVAHESVPDITLLCKRLRGEGVEIVGVEITQEAISYCDYVPKSKTAFIFGNEITGIETEVLALCDRHIMISMSGSKESLNVSVCAGIILFHFRP